MTDQTLAAERGAAFTALYDAVYPDLIRFAHRRVDPAAAEDVVAEAFLAAWRRYDDIPTQPEAARAWMFGVARGVLLNTHRSAERRRALGVRLAEVPPAHDAAPDDLVAQQLDVARAWSRLSERHQEALALTVLDGLDAVQAAAALDISPVAFRLRLSRARRALRLQLDHLLEEPASFPSTERTPDEQPA